jgi:hypothetical protein
MPVKTKVKLTYFKASGKYYSEGEYDSDHPWEEGWKIYSEVKNMLNSRQLPGLIEGCSEFYVLCEPVDGVPALIVPSDWSHNR